MTEYKFSTEKLGEGYYDNIHIAKFSQNKALCTVSIGNANKGTIPGIKEARDKAADLQNGGKEVCGKCVGSLYAD